MPTSLPNKSISSKQSDGTAVNNCVGVWAISIGVAAAACALFVYFGGRDQVASTFILCAAAFLIHLATLVTGSGEPCK